MAATKNNRGLVDYEEFLNRYLEAHKLGKPIIWIADEMGLTPEQARGRIQRMKDAGVKLPRLGRHINPIDIDKLNTLIEKETGEEK